MRGIFQLQHQLAHYEDHIDGVENPGHMQTHNNGVVREGIKKIDFLGKSPKLWVGGGQES